MIVTIANRSDVYEVEAVEVHGVWAVTPRLGGGLGSHRVTHAPTGLATSGPMTLRNASALARGLAAQWPEWESGHATVSDVACGTPVPPREMGEFIRDWRPPSPTRAEMVEDLMTAVDARDLDRARSLVASIRAAAP